MEDNGPPHNHNYHNIPRQRLGFSKIIWPANSLDLNPIETIWMELKDLLQEQIGPRMTARQIRLVLEQVRYPYFISNSTNSTIILTSVHLRHGQNIQKSTLTITLILCMNGSELVFRMEEEITLIFNF